MLILACEKQPLFAPTGSIITLTTTTNALSANGSIPIVAQVLEASGFPPHSGTQITFVTTLGQIQPAEANTDVNGQVTATFLAGGQNGTATITAISGGSNTGTSGALKIFVGTAGVGRVSVNANPQTVPAGGGSSTISAQVVDINGNLLVATPVNFTTTAGTLSSDLALTNSNGVATSVLTTNVQATVTASVGAQGGSSTPPATTTPATGGTTPTNSGQASGSVSVNVAGSPQLTITAPTTALSAGVAATFTFAVTPAATNPSPIRSVTVNWGDGTPVQDLGAITGSNQVSHTYGSTGSFTIAATVTDSFGTSVPVSTTVIVNPRPQPVVTLTGPTTTPTAGTVTAFTGSVAAAANSGAVIQSVVMDFGDGNTQQLGAITGATTLQHVYQTSGTFTATLTATDSNGGVGKSATSVFVQTATPLAVALTSSQVSSGGNTTVSFTATVVGLGNAVVVNYHWVFGGSNGTADTSTNQQSRTYPTGTSGVITVTVTVTTSDGRMATGSTVITP